MQKLDRKPHKKPGNKQKQLVELVERIGAVLHAVYLHHGVKLFIDVINGVGRLEMNLDTGIVRLKRHTALDGHDHRYIIARKCLLTADKAVDAGALRDHTHICGKKNMKEAKMGIPLLDLLSAILIHMCNIKAVRISILRVTAL